MICSSNVFFINNPDPEPDPKLMLKPNTDPNLFLFFFPDPQQSLMQISFADLHSFYADPDLG